MMFLRMGKTFWPGDMFPQCILQQDFVFSESRNIGWVALGLTEQGIADL